MIELNIFKQIELKTGIVTLEGDLDQPNATAFLDNMVSMMDKHALVTIILDLNNLTFLDSLGVGTLVRLQTKLQEVQGELKLICSKTAMLRVFELSGLWSEKSDNNRLSIFETMELAKQTS